MKINWQNYRFDFWSWVIIVSGLTMLVWALLKIFGVLKTPLIIEMLPYLTGASALLGVGIQTGKVLQRLNQVEEDVERNNRDIEKNNSRIEDLTREFIGLKTEFKYHPKE